MPEVGYLLGKIIDPMDIIIRVVGWPDVTDFCENFLNFSIFVECPPRILGDFMWRLERSLIVRCFCFSSLPNFLTVTLDMHVHLAHVCTSDFTNVL